LLNSVSFYLVSLGKAEKYMEAIEVSGQECRIEERNV
jgi:hypothetical protein